MLSIKMKQSYDSPTIIMFLMLLYLISTLIQGVLPISINRILLFLIIILIIIDFLSSSTKTRMIVVLYSLFVFLYMLLISTELGTSLRDMIYFLSTIMILLFFSEKRNFKCFKFALIRYEYIITKILYLLLFLTILSLFLNSSYIINWSDS